MLQKKTTGTNPNRMKLRVGVTDPGFIKSKTQTPQVGKPQRKY